MAATARFLYVQQNKKTLDGPYIIHARYPFCILEMHKAKKYIPGNSVVASFKVLKEIDLMSNEQNEKIEQDADKWYFSQMSQRLIEP